MPTKDETAKALAEAHFALDDGITRIFRLLEAEEAGEADPARPVKLLEVNPQTVEVGVEPVGFGPDHSRGVSHASVVIEVTPAEFERISRGDLPLPHGWRLGPELKRPAAAGASGAVQ